MHYRHRLVVLILLGTTLSACTREPATPLVAPGGEWISLFNGQNLDGWTAKISGHMVGDNYGNTFRVENGVLKVAYDQYDSFGHQFGSLFYQRKFSNYWLRVEYRFVGEQALGAPEWAYRDSGLQLHSQSPDTMTVDQEFPVSVELNLIGGKLFRSRPTGNVCTNGTLIRIDNKLLVGKCADTSKVSIRGDQWVTVLAKVQGNQSIQYAVNGMLVTTYQQPQLNPDDADAQRLLAAGAAAMLQDGYISLQSNSHPIEFRKIEVLPLDPQAIPAG